MAQTHSWKQSAHELFTIIRHEQSEGERRHPVLTRLRFTVEALDRKMLRLLGEKEYPVYIPPAVKTTKQLRDVILVDFMAEQPSRTQLFLKRGYLITKHSTFVTLKKVYRSVRASQT